MSRLLAATVSIAHAQNCMPVAPDAAGGAGCGTKVLRHHLTNVRKSAYPEGDAGREIPSRCHHETETAPGGAHARGTNT
jgi:hypothetical protein